MKRLSSIFLILAASMFGSNGATETRPNIVLILADDLGFSDLGCYGGEIRTPNLDRLAAEGVRFTQFYNCGVCRTTRASLLTGVHPRRRNRGRLLHPDMTTISEVLRAAGYRTGLVGKWHFPQRDVGFPVYRPTDRGFERYYGIAEGCCNYFDPARSFPPYDKGRTPTPFLDGEQPISKFPSDYYATDAFTDRAVAWLREFAPDARAGKAPFFLHLSYTAPHYPLHAKPEDIRRYRGRYDAGYHRLREDRHRRLIELGLIPRGTKLAPADPDGGDFRYDYAIPDWENHPRREHEQRRMEVYAAMVDALDQGIGRFLNALESEGVADNTIVMFLSDNGGCASHAGDRNPKEMQQVVEYNADFDGGVDTHDYVGAGWGWAQNSPFRRYKVWTYEGGIATPFIVRWPGKVRPGTINPAIGHVVDFMPTLMQLGRAPFLTKRDGVKTLPPEGQSLVPTILGKKETAPRFLFWGLYGNRAVRHGKWKLVWGTSKEKWELYNLDRDRTEMENVIDRHPNQFRRMRDAWLRWARRTGYPLNSDTL